jgi:outer membrane receptor protein involved in Fe transport
MRFLPILVTFITFSLGLFAQKGKIEGKVTDSKSGNAVTGVSVAVNGGKTVAATNVDGSFIITVDAGQKYTITLSSVGYSTKELADVEVTANQVTHLDVILEAISKTENAVVIRSTARKESVAALISYQKNTPVVAQVISAEAIRRSPDKNTGEVLKRVPGTSIQEGKYLVVRGLADRYNQAMLNGILLSSTEPDRKTFSFDIIPSSMIDNIIINKSFIPELPGEWAGGLIQVNTKDIPAKDFFTVQIGTGFNTQTIGKDFYSYKGSSTDFLGYDNGARALPANLPGKATFGALDNAQKTAYGKDFKNIWTAQSGSPLLNQTILISGGFNKKLGNTSKLAAILAINYNRTNRKTVYQNQINTFSDNVASVSFDYFNDKYNEEVLAGALANITLQLGNNSKISFKNMLNVNTSNYSTIRTGKDFESNSTIGDNIRATELAFKANTFFNSQLSGEHNIKKYGAKIHWFGSFNILDQYIPDQRRIQYNQDDPTDLTSPYSLLIGASKSSQKSGSRYYGFLNDYVYTAGGDISKNFTFNNLTQTVKGGYFFQVKDRLFDSRPFAIYLPKDNPALRHLSADQVFDPANFGNGFDDGKLAFNELSGASYRYIANSILNAGFLQFDNQISAKFHAVWGLRVENFDQVIGSLIKSDPRYVYSKVTDYLPGVNLTYKLSNTTNFRLSGSQTVIRPEFRELSTFQFFDFDLGATVAGNTALVRTKVSNFDLRYELYPRAGELFTLGVFYKYFKNPIEAYFNPSSGGASTYNFINADEANSFGAELEFRKKLDFNEALKNFTFQGNISYIYNRVTSKKNPVDRPMQGQSPYLLNASIQYDIEKYGINATLLFNQIGRRIAFVGGGDADNFTPSIWENPRAVVDFQLAKKIMKQKGELKLNVSDIFNQMAIYYNDLNNNKKYDKGVDAFAIKRKYGTNLSISFGYNF